MAENQENEVAMTQDGHEPTADEAVANDTPAAEEVQQPLEPLYYRKLRQFCRDVELENIRSVIEETPGIDLNITEPDQGYTPLLELVSLAVMDDETTTGPECIEFLVAHGADVNVKDLKGWTSLHHCARYNTDTSLAIAKCLIKLGADPNANQRIAPKVEADSNETHTHENNDDDCECGGHIGALIDAAIKKVDPNAAAEKQTKELDVTPLHHACGFGDNFPVAKLLVDSGAKVDVYDEVAGTPLQVAVGDGREDHCELLLSKPGGTACLSRYDTKGRLPIHRAAERGTRNMVRMLVEAGSLVDVALEGDDVQEGEKGLTPLMLACQEARREGRVEVIEYLLDHGADATKIAEKGQTPLLLSVMAKNVHAAKLIVKYGGDIKAAVGPFEDVNALHMAGIAGAAELCEWLVKEAGMAVNAEDNQGYTALIHAAGYGGSAEAIRMLVSTLGADIESAIEDGRRPLHFAAFKGQEACAKELVALGADKEATDYNGWTPLHFAARYHHPGVIRVLLDSGVEVGKKVEGGPQPKRVDGEEFDIADFTAVDLARITRDGQECVDILVAAGGVLSDETKDLQDEDLWKEEGGSCCVM